MQYMDEFRDGAWAQTILARITHKLQAGRRYQLMEFCGGHTHAIARYGLSQLLPPAIELIHGPGCPVCVLPIGRVDLAIELALTHRVLLCTYGDVLCVPASEQQSLLKAKAQGADIRMLYTAQDSLKLAQENPDKEVVFFAIGFETTTPPTAVVVQQAKALGLKNFSIVCNHVLTPTIMHYMLEAAKADGGVQIDGFIGPAHVSTIIGSDAFKPFVAQYHKPVVVAGFEPLDVLQAIDMLITQLNANRAEVENEYQRCVSDAGNRKAQALMASVFTLRDAFEWRGLGSVPHSAFMLREEYAAYDAERKFQLSTRQVPDHPHCECGAILAGRKHPRDCKLFATVCTPDNPMGSCMVSSEGGCAAHYTYGRHRDFAVAA